MLRWLPLAMPIAVAVIALVEWSDLRQRALAGELVTGIGAVAIVLAVLGVRAARGGVRRPGAFVLCCVLAALGFVRVVPDLAWNAAHAVLDADTLRHDLVSTWLTLAIAVLAGVAAGQVAKPVAGGRP